MTTIDHKSALAKAIEDQPRKAYCFPVAGFFGLGGRAIHGVAIRRSNKTEDDSAIVAAHKYLAELTKAAGEDAAATLKTEGDILGDAKILELIVRLCREVDQDSIAAAPGDPSKWRATKENWLAFPGPQWMRDNLGTDQLATLLNLIHEVRNAQAPAPTEIDDAHVEAVVQLCNDHAGDDIPEAVMAGFSRVKLTHLVVLLSMKLQESRLAVDLLIKQAEEAAAAKTTTAACERVADSSVADTIAPNE